MALETWFQQWHSPFLHNEPVHLRNITNERKTYSNPTRFFPIFWSLNLLKSHGKKQPIKEQHYEATNNDFQIPKEFYENSPLDFPDPFEEPHSKIQQNKSNNYTLNEKPLEVTGPFKTWYKWKTLDFVYPTTEAKYQALANGDLIKENNLPLGIEVYKHRIFLAMPKWKRGVPITLAQLPRYPKEESPDLAPYPNWGWHSEKNCELITSVFRMQVDECGRMWVLDSGKVSITTEEAKQHCPPKLLIFDLETDQLVTMYVFSKKFILEDGLYSNIVVDIRNGYCSDAYAYMSDVWRFGIVVYRLFDGEAWRISNHFFYPDPMASLYKLHHLKFHWMDGVFGMALSPVNRNGDRLMYFHSMSGYHEFSVQTSYLRNEIHLEKEDAFNVIGQSRGDQGHVSSSVMDSNGVMFFNLVTKDSIGCWDSRKPYKRENLAVVAKNKKTLVFPNDIRLDQDSKKQSMWIITNRLPYYLIEGLDTTKYNFRVMSAYTDEAIKGTICDPNVFNPSTFVPHQDCE
ncbi:hypothetical protein ABEB36_009766 [Hypothenemus hampei]|uniref:Uncharacterized protein n=1 Tax=Hypothenemus hampei TaxID=57062 RepID=A0ABD1ELH1_HYPHA